MSLGERIIRRGGRPVPGFGIESTADTVGAVVGAAAAV